MKAIFIVLMTITLLTLSALAGEGKHGVRYAFIHELFTYASTQTGMVITFTSKLPDVDPSQIVCFINSTNGMIKVRVKQDGTTVGFPVDEKLLTENPLVTHNQADGSVKIQGVFPQRKESPSGGLDAPGDVR